MIEILFLIGCILLTLFFLVLVIRMLVVRQRAAALMRWGTRPGPPAEGDKPYAGACMTHATEKELGMLAILACLLALHALLTDGWWGVAKIGIAGVIIFGAGPLITLGFWTLVGRDDGLAKMAHKLLNWAVTCLALPIVSLLG
jgi:hypothetical protein